MIIHDALSKLERATRVQTLMEKVGLSPTWRGAIRAEAAVERRASLTRCHGFSVSYRSAASGVIGPNVKHF